MSKVLVSYFSASGITKNVAHKIVNAIQGDLFEIEPQDKYTSDDLNWKNPKSRSSIEMKDKKSKPKIIKKIEHLDDYQIILIGFPVWWDKAPTIINTFLEENDFKNKSIYIFVTSGGSSVEDSWKDLKENYRELNFIDAKKWNGTETIDEYQSWLI